LIPIHIEELLLERSSDSAAFFVLKRSLKELSKQDVFNILYDSAINVLVGELNGRFFIGLNDVLSNPSKIIYTEADIKKHYKGDITHKLRCIFNAFKNEKFSNILQMDLICTKSDFNPRSLFQTVVPDVVEYRLSNTVLTSQIVVAINSVFNSKSIKDLVQEVPQQISVKEFENLHFKNVSTLSPFGTFKRSSNFNKTITETLSVLENFDNNLTDDVITEFKCFINNSTRRLYIYEYESIDDVMDKFSSFVFEKYKNQIISYDSSKDRTSKMLELSDLMLKILDPATFNTFEIILKITQNLSVLKGEILRSISNLDTTPYIGTFNTHKGIVIQVQSDVVKIVDRYKIAAETFLKNNTTFSTGLVNSSTKKG